MSVPERGTHEALFYVDPHAVVERAADYLIGGSGDGVALVAARADRLSELERALAARGFDLADARATERLVTLDAEATLATVLVDGMPDRAAFQVRIASLVGWLARRGELRVYGEMADLLWSEGRRDAALRLEQLWNELRITHRFSLLCSYREVAPVDLRVAQLGDVSATHECASTAQAPDAERRRPGEDAATGGHAELERAGELAGRLRSEAERDELLRGIAEARAAQHAAEDAVRARDEILAMLTHDLRNPLGTIVMGATALLEQDGTPDLRSQRVRSIAERIHRQAERMTRQIRDLQDFIELQSGRLAIERVPHAAATIVAAANELTAPLARERGITFGAHTAADLPRVACDAERVVQALSSLVMNAIKVTARGGSVEVGARAGEDGRVVFQVHHGGPALDGDELAQLFTPGWRSKHAGYRGTALGFTLARGVVEAHGGTIWAEGGRGAGGTLLFTLQPGP